ncbi:MULTISPECIES: STAS domain-containing protein [Terrilactibacillus]|uniref:STAS domain-containing protein n=2 Tax=Terrilactibacillus TaxID=1795633 RepID=A0A6N8CSF7_9BACI|nr:MULTISPECIES: STAS domain-containing protein [Terrilactibacillus]MTT33139.1 STAS domain-containing protein [Terrilactibacillus tamarindi]
MPKVVIKYIKDKRKEINEAWMRKMAEELPEFPNYRAPNQNLSNANDNFVDVIYTYLLNIENTDDVRDFIKKIMKLEVPINYLSIGLQVFRRVVMEVIKRSEKDPENLLELYEHTDRVVEPIFNQLIKDTTETWERTISIQKSELLELSAPLIPILDRISVMPLVGTIDTERAKLIMENLLQGVIDHHAEVVLIDITGVPVVDTMVAHHIIQASEAVRLVGSKCILVGIRPEIAQTIVNLGIELDQFPTKSSLQRGIEEALKITERKVITITEGNGKQ